MLSKGLVVGIVVLFIASAVIPITFGYNIKTTEKDMDYNKIDFLYYFDKYYPPNVSDYEKRFLINYSLNDIELKELTLPIETSPKKMSVGSMDSPWPIYCHDTYHTGRSYYSTTDNLGTEKWRFAGDWIESSTVIADDGTIYFGDLDNYLYALYQNGTMKWRFKTSDWIWSTPAIADNGIIYVGSWDEYLYAINSNGALKWKFNSGAIIPTSPVIAEDDTIYFGTEGAKVYAVNPNGTEKWHYETGSWITSDPAIGDDGTVYIGSMDYYLYSLYPNGTLRWRFYVGDRIYGSPSIADDGTVYIGSSWNGYLYALYPNGTLKWKYGGAGTPNNPSIASDGTIYSGYLYDLVALNPNGTLKWNFNVGDSRFIGNSAPAISADGTIYFGIHLGTPGNSDGGEIIAVNPDGSEKWRKKIANKWVSSSPSIAEDGTIYIGSSYDMGGGYLHAFGNPENNEPPTPPAITGPTNGNSGESYTYTFVSTDPENYPLKYYVDWGDGTNTGWTLEYDSGEEVEISHTWDEQGTYLVKAKAMDISNAESDWGTLSVTMPLDLQFIKNNNLQINQYHSNQFLLRTFQRILLNLR